MRCSGESASRCPCPAWLSARWSSDSGSTATRYLARSRLPDAAAATLAGVRGSRWATSGSPCSRALACEHSAATSSGEKNSSAVALLRCAAACASSAARCICSASASMARS
eukprot:scaffold39838_cov70-Phaeocystis_antarctica.AAC.6